MLSLQGAPILYSTKLQIQYKLKKSFPPANLFQKANYTEAQTWAERKHPQVSNKAPSFRLSKFGGILESKRSPKANQYSNIPTSLLAVICPFHSTNNTPNIPFFLYFPRLFCFPCSRTFNTPEHFTNHEYMGPTCNDYSAPVPNRQVHPLTCTTTIPYHNQDRLPGQVTWYIPLKTLHPGTHIAHPKFRSPTIGDIHFSSQSFISVYFCSNELFYRSSTINCQYRQYSFFITIFYFSLFLQQWNFLQELYYKLKPIFLRSTLRTTSKYLAQLPHSSYSTDWNLRKELFL